jgi:hypothetical protein
MMVDRTTCNPAGASRETEGRKREGKKKKIN